MSTGTPVGAPPGGRCEGTRRRDGGRCKAAALAGERFCAAHHPDPERRAAFLERSASGGRETWRRRMVEVEERAGVLAPVAAALADVVERLRSEGDVDVPRLRCLVYALATLGRVVEVSTLVPALEAMEARIRALESTPGGGP